MQDGENETNKKGQGERKKIKFDETLTITIKDIDSYINIIVKRWSVTAWSLTISSLPLFVITNIITTIAEKPSSCEVIEEARSICHVKSPRKEGNAVFGIDVVYKA